MNVGLASLQSNSINYSARQYILKPIVLLVVGIALAIFSAVSIDSVVSQVLRNNRRNNHPSNPPRRDTFTTSFSSNSHPSNTSKIAPSSNILLQVPDHGIIHSPQYLSVSHEELKADPFSYIKSLAKTIRSTGPSVNFRVTFKNQDDSAPALDAGGPTRQLFNLLFQSLKQQFSPERLEDPTNPVDFHPHTNKGGLTSLVPQGEPTNNPKASIFYDIGTVMMHVYFHSRSPLIGSVFHESLFSAILSLNDDEILTPFDQLSDTTKMKMFITLINAQQASGENFDDYMDVLFFLEKGNQFTEEDLKNEKVKNFYAISSLQEDCRDYLGQGGDECDLNAVQFDWNKIKDNKKEFIAKYLNYFLQQKTDSLGTIGLTLFPIHTMAQAMREVATGNWWKAIRSQSSDTVTSSQTVNIEAAKRLQRKIQGELDRKLLVSKIEVLCGNSEVEKKQVDWIKNWILNPETTDTLVEGLLTFWTGSKYIDWDKVKNIYIYSGLRGALPGSSSCGRFLTIANIYSPKNTRGELGPLHNHTEEGYHQVLNKIASEFSNVFTQS